jgi:hypothetical protein
MASTTHSAAQIAALFGLALFTAAQAEAAGSCSARSGASVAPVVELYTSEGCSSCPPADRWLSRLQADPAVVALAFHVDYWDRLGWKDRFASAAYTQRQTQSQRSSGARFSYTPQVIVDGADRPEWSGIVAPLSAKGRPASNVDVSLKREGNHFTASVTAAPGAPPQLAAYWAVTEQGHITTVKAGENDGATLKHDYVVREYKPVAAWRAAPDAPATLEFDATLTADAAHPRQVNLVIVNADNGRPVQALKLGC